MKINTGSTVSLTTFRLRKEYKQCQAYNESLRNGNLFKILNVCYNHCANTKFIEYQEKSLSSGTCVRFFYVLNLL